MTSEIKSNKYSITQDPLMKSIKLHRLLVERYLIQQMILEAQNYENMFASLLKKIDAIPDDPRPNYAGARAKTKKIAETTIRGYIAWARKTLKKNDRIVWFLRWARYWLEVGVLKLPADDALKELNKKTGSNYTASAYMPIHLVQRDLEHYMDSGAPSIQNYVFDKQTPRELLNTLQTMEREWLSSANDDAGAEEMFKKNRLIEQKDDDDVILKFPDGFAWLDLQAPTDDDEGAAMGHCGNRASYSPDETILSLRKPVKYQHKLWWYPVCTFILDEDGRLGEMKGRANEKPQNRYHPYIIALLKTNLIKGIKGGGYAPENNFSLDDLSEAERNSLGEIKPSLLSMLQIYQKLGVTDELKRKILEWMDEYNIAPASITKPRWIGDKIVIEKLSNINELVETYGNETAIRALDYLSGKDHFEVYDAAADLSTMRDLIESLKEEELISVGKHLQKNYPDDANDIEDYDPSNARDVIELFEQTQDDELQRIGNHSFMIGLESGAENEISEYFRREIENNPYVVFLDKKGKILEKLQWDTPCYLVVPIKDLIDSFKSAGEEDVGDSIQNFGWNSVFEDIKINLSEPQNGWSGYDEKSAKETFADMIDIFK